MASKLGGYMGKVIQIDLTAETVKEHPWAGSSLPDCRSAIPSAPSVSARRERN